LIGFSNETRLVNAQTDRYGSPIVTVGLPVSGNDWSTSNLPAILRVQKVEHVLPTEALDAATAAEKSKIRKNCACFIFIFLVSD